MNNEQGRSLTEMLGMLAIMGILSVAGVAMYNSAMNKHRANELIYEAQKRATTVAMQITAGRDTLSIGEFTNPSGYVFGVEKNPYNANQFNITIDGVATDICTQMKNAVGDATVIRKINDTCTEITFNNDLSRTAYASDAQTKQECENAGNKWCTNGDNVSGTLCISGANCCADVKYNSQCQTCSPNTGWVSNKSSTTPCDFDGDGVNDSLCNRGICVDPNVTEGAECMTNDDCGGVGSGYYCKIAYDENVNLNGTFNTTNTDCYKDLKGTCTLVTSGTARLTASQRAVLTESFGVNIERGPDVNWWSANNWCLAKGKHLIDVSDMGCYRLGNTLVQEGQDGAVCCKQGQACQQGNWGITLWNGRNILPGKAEEVAKFSDQMITLRKVFSGAWFWTKSPYGNTSQNSCYAFHVISSYGQINPNGRNVSAHATSTLCR